MNTIPHPIEQEELMAYRDGELPGDRAGAVVSHLEDCQECQALITDFQNIARTLTDWRVESSDVKPLRWPVQSKWASLKPLLEYGAIAAVIFLFAVLGVRMIGVNANTVFSQVSTSERVESAPKETKQFDRLEQFSKLQSVPPPPPPPPAGPVQPQSPGETSLALNGPMIVRTAELAVTVQGFEQARASLEQTLKRYHGYIDNLQITAPVGNPRTLAGKLRIPASQLDTVLTELKKLGRVDTEAQTGEEVTAQYVDLQARLANSRNTQQRLNDVLRQRTGTLSDVLEIEKEIARVRGEIESMEAERKTMATQVAYATLNLTLTEDYKAHLETVPPSTWTRFRNSAVDGYQSMTEGVVGLVVFVLSYGPSFLLWGALLFFPVRVLWRRLVAKWTQGTAGPIPAGR